MHVDRERRIAATACALALLAASPASAAERAGAGGAVPEDPEEARAALEETEEELAGATAELADVEARLDAVEAEVAAADQQLAAVAEQLADVERRLAIAVADTALAERTLDAARERLAAADGLLEDADTRFQDARSTIDARAAHVWMHGPGAEVELLLGSLGNARDLHDVAVVAHTTRSQLAADRELLDQATTSAAAAASARSVVADERAELTAATAAAYEARTAAAELVAHQQLLVAETEAQAETKRAALERVEGDAEARALLVSRLTVRVEELREAALEAWMRDVQDVPVDGPPPAWAAALPPAGRAISPAIDAAAAASGIDGQLYAALVWTESAFRPTAVSPSGAIGLSQLMPFTAAELGVDPYDPVQNLHGGARYLRQQLDRFDRIDLALAAYNAGPGRVERAGRTVPDIVETQLYVLRILDRWERLR